MNDQPIPRIVIVGGGAGGLNLATRLSRSMGRKKLADIVLVDENLSHIWKPSLHEFAAGTKGPEAEISFLEHSNRNGYKFRLGRFAGIDYQGRKVMLDPVVSENQVALSPARAVAYDFLVLAIGSRSNDFGTPGVAEHCLFLDTPTQAKRLQTEILNLCLRLETGALEGKGKAVRIAIVGGGATGVELAAELREATEQLGRNGIEKLRLPDTVSITVIEGADRLVAALPVDISEKVRKELSALDIDVRLNTRVTGVSEKSIALGEDGFLDAEIVVWAAGIRSNEALASAADLEVGSLGRLKVKPTLQTTRDDNIFVLGDAADCFWPEKDSPLPPRAQVASQQAVFLEGQIKRAVSGHPLTAFRYTDRGSLVALSSNAAIGSLMGRALGTMTIKGWLARRAYKYLHYQHEASIQGHFRALLHTVLATAMRRVRPRLKLH
ncbi:MAG: NAD(P)/FAD-dependent oxidoreductase [Paracoccaceae bacterium]